MSKYEQLYASITGIKKKVKLDRKKLESVLKDLKINKPLLPPINKDDKIKKLILKVSD